MKFSRKLSGFLQVHTGYLTFSLKNTDLSISGRKLTFLWKWVISIRHRRENGVDTLKLHHDTLLKTLKNNGELMTTRSFNGPETLFWMKLVHAKPILLAGGSHDMIWTKENNLFLFHAIKLFSIQKSAQKLPHRLSACYGSAKTSKACTFHNRLVGVANGYDRTESQFISLTSTTYEQPFSERQMDTLWTVEDIQYQKCILESETKTQIKKPWRPATDRFIKKGLAIFFQFHYQAAKSPNHIQFTIKNSPFGHFQSFCFDNVWSSRSTTHASSELD